MTFASTIEKKTKNKYKDYIIKPDDYYNHPTFYVKNLADYIKLISIISSVEYSPIYGERVIYRGTSDSSYRLEPGLDRIKDLVEDSEHALINEFLIRRPDAFTGLTEFGVLAKMQHYGLPTRLLDFTMNPLVALFFACESKFSKNGRVVCHSTFLNNDSIPIVNTVCDRIFNKDFDEAYSVDKYICDEDLSLKTYLAYSYMYDETMVIRPKYWNQRIANQAGLFMFFFNNLVDRYRSVLIHSKKLGVEKAIEEYSYGSVNLKDIKKILATESIDKYAHLDDEYLSDDYLNVMKENYSIGEFWRIAENRFLMRCSIMKFNKKKLQNSFCSIIIDANSKKKLLKELSTVGISADFIYPELEYSSKEIRNMFDV